MDNQLQILLSKTDLLQKILKIDKNLALLNVNEINILQKCGLISNKKQYTKIGRDFIYAIQELLNTNPDQILKLIELKEKRVLDVGCAGGAYSFYAAEQGAHKILALDINENYLEFLNIYKQIKKTNNIETLHYDIDDIDKLVLDDKYDVILLRLVAPYINLEKFLKYIKNVCAPDAYFYIKTHSQYYYFSLILKSLNKLAIPRIILGILGLLNAFCWHVFHKRLVIKYKNSTHNDVFISHKQIRSFLLNNKYQLLEHTFKQSKETPVYLTKLKQ